MNEESLTIFECTIPGRVPVKKNTQKVVLLQTGRRAAIYSAKFRSWEEGAILECIQANKSRRCYAGPMIAFFSFYFQDHMHEPDVSNLVEGPQDVLKKAGVIEDDRLIHELHARKIFDSNEEPRVEIVLRRFR